MVEVDLKGHMIEIVVNMAQLMSRTVNKEVDKVIEKEGTKIVEKDFESYLYAAILLAFSRKPVDASSVAKALSAANAGMDNEYLLRIATSLNLNEKLAYGPAAYFLNGINVEPDTDKLCKIVSSVGVKSDKELASEVISLYQEMESKSRQDDISRERFNEFIIPLFKALGGMTVKEVERLYEIKGFAEFMKAGFMPYILAAGTAYYTGWTIKLSGKEKNREMIKGMVEAANIAPDAKMLDYLMNSLNLDETPPLAYIAAFYFIKALSKEPNINNMADVVRTVGITPDPSVVGYVLTAFT
jgi:ribosomal protein L12E/L44/L45/RPP1/RPP2